MKVGLVCPYSFHRPGGVQNHVLGLAGWLKSVGHQIAILAPGFPPDGMLADYGLSDAEFTTGGKAVPLSSTSRWRGSTSGSARRQGQSLAGCRRFRRGAPARADRPQPEPA